MRLRVFRAESVATAMRQMRAELGGEALILSVRRVAGGVELTAGQEPAGPAPLRPRAPERIPLRPAAAPRAAAAPVAEDRAELLAWHGVPAALSRKLRAGPLPFALSACLRFAALPLGAGAAPLLMAGAPGAGKTLTVARLATRLVLAGAPPLVITADARRAGSAEQLAAFTRLLGVELLAAGQPATLARALARRGGNAAVLIDAPGIDPFDRGEQAMLADLAQAAGATSIAVIPAGLDPLESGEMAAAQSDAGVKSLVATRLDLARRLGGVLAAADAGLALAEFGVGPGAADGLTAASPARLAQDLAARRPSPPPPMQKVRV